MHICVYIWMCLCPFVLISDFVLMSVFLCVRFVEAKIMNKLPICYYVNGSVHRTRKSREKKIEFESESKDELFFFSRFFVGFSFLVKLTKYFCNVQHLFVLVGTTKNDVENEKNVECFVGCENLFSRIAFVNLSIRVFRLFFFSMVCHLCNISLVYVFSSTVMS